MRVKASAALLAGGLLLAAGLAAAETPPAGAQQLPGRSLESLLAYAREHNPELAAMRAEAQAAEERIGPAGALPDPTFRVELQDLSNEATGGRFNVLPARVGSSKYTFAQALPFWGKRELRRDIAEADAEQARGRADATWLELAARLKIAYAQYYLVSRSERLTREIVDLLAQLEKITRNRYANGLIPQQDVIRAQVEQSGMKSELIMLETERHHLRARVNALLRRAAHAPLAEPDVLRALPAPAELVPTALEARLQARNPLLSVNGAQIAAAEKSRELTYRNRYPDFTVGVSPIQERNRVGEWELMVEMNIPLQQGTRRAQEREAEAMLTAAQARREASRVQLSSELAETLVSLDSARRVEQLNAASLLPQAELTYQAAVAGYETGKVDFATLLDAQRQIRKARLDILKAQVEQQVRLAEIERLVGEDL